MLGKFVYLEKFQDGIRMVLELSINGNKIKALIDTGASVNYFCSSLKFLEVNKKDYASVTGFTGHTKRAYGIKVFKTDLLDLEFSNFYQLSLDHLGVNCVMGIDFLVKNGIQLNIPECNYEKITGVNVIVL
jgi:hypothetical protein